MAEPKGCRNTAPSSDVRLAAVLHPAGSDPDLQITVQGRGKRIAQDLDLTINLRGLRSAAHRPSFARTPRTKP